MKAIELKPTDLLAVSIPKEYSGYTEFKVSSTGYVCYKLQNVWQAMPPRLIGGSYTLLGTCTPDHIDFDVNSLVEQVIIRNEVPTRAAGFLDSYRFKNYQSENQYNDSLDSPNSSFRSLLSSNGLYFEEPQYCGCSGPCGIPCTYADWDENGRNIVQKLLIIKPLK